MRAVPHRYTNNTRGDGTVVVKLRDLFAPGSPGALLWQRRLGDTLGWTDH